LTGLIIALVAAAAVIAAWAFTVGWIRGIEGDAETEARTYVASDDVLLLDPAANCLGVASAGALQVRGNGCLLVTETEIVFVMWAPRKLTSIPRHSILAIDTVRSHLGKTKGRLLLKVHFRNRKGAEDSVAWLVRDLDTWTAELSRA